MFYTKLHPSPKYLIFKLERTKFHRTGPKIKLDTTHKWLSISWLVKIFQGRNRRGTRERRKYRDLQGVFHFAREIESIYISAFQTIFAVSNSKSESAGNSTFNILTNRAHRGRGWSTLFFMWTACASQPEWSVVHPNWFFPWRQAKDYSPRCRRNAEYLFRMKSWVWAMDVSPACNTR